MAGIGSFNLTIETALLAKEADFAFRVTSDKAHNDCLFLTALKPVDTTQLYSGELVLE